VLQASPSEFNGKPVDVDADAPAISINDTAGAEVAFRLAGGAGSPLSTPEAMVNSLPGADTGMGYNFTTPVAIGGATTVGPPSVSVNDTGNFESMFAGGGSAYVVQGSIGFAAPPVAVGPSDGDSAMATLNPISGDAVVWPALDAGLRPVVNVRETFANGAAQLASLSAPISGPINSLTIGPSGQGSALVAFEQGLSSTSQVAVADILAPPGQFTLQTPGGWVAPSKALISWSPALTGSPPVSYDVIVDGRIRATNLTTDNYKLTGLGNGRHHVNILATDGQGQETLSGPSPLYIDTGPPAVLVKRLGHHHTILVEVRDDESGPLAHGTRISFGDHSRTVRNRLSAQHQYRHKGTYVVVVRCRDYAGNGAVDRLRIRVR
jgi:hypothetical protein